MVVAENGIHFYERKSMKDSPLGDIQKVDMGIALSHFDLCMTEDNIPGGFVCREPEISVPEDVYYIVSWERAN